MARREQGGKNLKICQGKRKKLKKMARREQIGLFKDFLEFILQKIVMRRQRH